MRNFESGQGSGKGRKEEEKISAMWALKIAGTAIAGLALALALWTIEIVTKWKGRDAMDKSLDSNEDADDQFHDVGSAWDDDGVKEEVNSSCSETIKVF